jgi:hypothetical protein
MLRGGVQFPTAVMRLLSRRAREPNWLSQCEFGADGIVRMREARFHFSCRTLQERPRAGGFFCSPGQGLRRMEAYAIMKRGLLNMKRENTGRLVRLGMLAALSLLLVYLFGSPYSPARRSSSTTWRTCHTIRYIPVRAAVGSGADRRGQHAAGASGIAK